MGSYRLPGGFELGARFRYATGRPYTPLGHEFDIFSADGNRYFRNPDVDPLSARLAPFHQLDMRVDKSWLFQSWTLTAWCEMRNGFRNFRLDRIGTAR